MMLGGGGKRFPVFVKIFFKILASDQRKRSALHRTAKLIHTLENVEVFNDKFPNYAKYIIVTLLHETSNKGYQS